MGSSEPNGNGRITNADLREVVRDATESIRNEFRAEIAATGTQIGAVESSLKARLETLKWRMIAALLGGQVLASLVAAFVARITPAQAATTAAHFVSTLLT